MTPRWRRRAAGATALCCLVAIFIGVEQFSHNSGTSDSLPPSAAPGAKQVCGKAILRSPYSYDGAAGPYKSGETGLPTFGEPGTDFPHDTAGTVLPTGKNDYLSYQLQPDTVYYLLPGTHVGGFQADTNDAFVGGRLGGISTILSGDYQGGTAAIDSNSTIGDQSGVTIEYLTIEKYQPHVDAGAINQDANTDWTIKYNTVTLNVPGAGIIAGTGNAIENNCLTLNGQYGFQAVNVDGYHRDPLTGGPYDVTVAGNEISYNDTCDLSGLLENSAIGWNHYNPVPTSYRNPDCGTVVGDGNQGGFKLWSTNGVTIKDNYVHNNWGPGGWADTDNANTTWTDNVINDNEGPAIVEEISYNFAITDNYLSHNDWTDGLSNSSFPQAAIYINSSGSDTTFGGVPACSQPACAGQPAYRDRSLIIGNTLVDNGGSVFLFQDSNRYCSDGSDGACTLVDDGPAGPFNVSSCKANLPSASMDTTTYVGHGTGSPREDWIDGCLWRAENISISRNTIDFTSAHVMDCNAQAWPDCGAGGLFSEYGSPPNRQPGAIIATDLTFFENDIWSDNIYNGPSRFYAWNQGSGANPVSWADWTGSVSSGDRCGTSGDLQSGSCTGPFGQDAGSSYNP
jgi:hypothetical protein